MISIVVAIASNNVIGKGNKLLWRLPSDLQHFKEITTGGTIIMGRKTFQSLPKVLPNRHHIVMTKDSDFIFEHDMVTIIHSIEELLPMINNIDSFVIGGGEIYKALLPFCDKLYITKVGQEFEGDTFFPIINYDEWEQVFKQEGKLDEKNIIPHTFLILERK